MSDFLSEAKHYRYLVIYTDTPPTLHRSLREMGDSLEINYSTISKHLADNDYCLLETQEGEQYLIKKINWEPNST